MPLPLLNSWRFSITLRRLRPALAVLIGLLVFLEIVVFLPTTAEEGGTKTAVVDPETLKADQEQTLAVGIPKNKIPDYSVEDFQFVSTQGSTKLWKLQAEKAYLYNKDHLTHAIRVKAFIYDPDGKITIVTGKEAKYQMNRRDLEVYGDVHTVFADGFALDSEYLRHRPDIKKIDIPTQYPVVGDGSAAEADGQLIHFTSEGFESDMATSVVTLPRQARVTMTRKSDPKDTTTVESDRAVMDRARQISHFTMFATRPLKKQFVHITQPTLDTVSRRADLNYGDSSKILQYLTAYEDVLIRELPAPPEKTTIGAPPTPKESSFKYATGGRADFDSKNSIVKLTQYPQVYQDADTVTGDIILLHRDTDIVEVEHSNAFSQGTERE